MSVDDRLCALCGADEARSCADSRDLCARCVDAPWLPGHGDVEIAPAEGDSRDAEETISW